MFRLIKSTNKFTHKITNYWLAALSIRNSTGSTGPTHIFIQSDVQFEYVVISNLQIDIFL